MTNNPIKDLEMAFYFANSPNTAVKVEIERQYEANEISSEQFIALAKKYLKELKNKEAKNDK